MSEKIRIMIVDDHTVIRHGLSLMLQQKPDFEVVGEAGDGLQAIDLARAIKPDVIMMDLVMPRMDGVEAIKCIHQEFPAMRIMVLTSFGDEERQVAAIKAGALGLLGKDSQPAELLAAIRDVYEGKASLTPDFARRLVLEIQAPKKAAQPETALTEREMEVLKMAASGLSNHEIADRLFLSEGTVRFHLSNIIHKLNLPNRTQAVLYALRQGWTPLK
jgi:NarL family two-component system response regulator LiaR